MTADEIIAVTESVMLEEPSTAALAILMVQERILRQAGQELERKGNAFVHVAKRYRKEASAIAEKYPGHFDEEPQS